MKNKPNTNTKDKVFLNHILKNDLYDYPVDIFIEDDYKVVYKELKKYYNEQEGKHIEDETHFKNIIEANNVHEEHDLNSKILHMMFDDTDYNTMGSEYVDKLFKEYATAVKIKKGLSKQIDDCRDPEKLKELVEKELKEEELLEDEDEIDVLETTPYISDDFYENAPEFIKKTCKYFSENKRVKDMFLTSQLMILSSLFPNVYARYGQQSRDVWSNLFGFISTEAANGKSVINFNKDLIKEIRTDFDKIENLQESSQTNRKSFLLSANSSQAGFINQFVFNDGIGLVIDTEADVVSENKSKDWGDYSTVIRQSFHHEEISKNRVSTGLYNIEKPKLSMVLTGTINQIFKFVQNSEDGMLSRILFYTYKDKKQEWISQKPSKENVNRIFLNEYSKELFEIYNYFLHTEREFTLTDEQWEKHTKFFGVNFEKAKKFDGSTDMIKRHGVMAFKLMMILSIMRAYENRSLFNEIGDIVCSDIDFDNAISLMYTYSKHSNIIYTNVDILTKKTIIVKNEKEKMFEELEETFNTQQLKNKMKKYKISESTLKRLMKTWKDNGIIKKINRTTFQKI